MKAMALLGGIAAARQIPSDEWTEPVTMSSGMP